MLNNDPKHLHIELNVLLETDWHLNDAVSFNALLRERITAQNGEGLIILARKKSPFKISCIVLDQLGLLSNIDRHLLGAHHITVII